MNEETKWETMDPVQCVEDIRKCFEIVRNDKYKVKPVVLSPNEYEQWKKLGLI